MIRLAQSLCFSSESQSFTYETFILSDLKESPLLGESSHVTFSRMAKYSSLTVSHIFRTTARSYRAQSVFASVLEFMHRVMNGAKICSAPKIFTLLFIIPRTVLLSSI